jgi:hypothetical protein
MQEQAITTEQEAREYIRGASETEIGREILKAARYEPEALEVIREYDPDTVRKSLLRVANTVHEVMVCLTGASRTIEAG